MNAVQNEATAPAGKLAYLTPILGTDRPVLTENHGNRK